MTKRVIQKLLVTETILYICKYIYIFIPNVLSDTSYAQDTRLKGRSRLGPISGV